MHLQEFDYFASGYRYARTTVFADVQKIPLQNSSLDGIIILHVLEHVPSLDTALRELKRVLLPGGFLQHDTPCCAEDSGDLNPCLMSLPHRGPPCARCEADPVDPFESLGWQTQRVL